MYLSAFPFTSLDTPIIVRERKKLASHRVTSNLDSLLLQENVTRSPITATRSLVTAIGRAEECYRKIKEEYACKKRPNWFKKFPFFISYHQSKK